MVGNARRDGGPGVGARAARRGSRRCPYGPGRMIASTDRGPLDERLALLRDAVEAARSLGLEEEAARARHVARRVGRRAGFGGDLYVMALAGGTGVGKSSVLNAL